jgi:precorrin-2 dehydrogenase/sirohydrochlorin ferrochelatase
MRYYPIYLDMRGRRALVVGGGAVGSRKAATLLRAGARVTVVSPQATAAIRKLAEEEQLTWHARGYRSADMMAMFLVFSATDDPELNRRIEADAARHHVLCNFADQPARGHFILPSIVERGDLLVSISTSGTSPAVARRLRQDLDTHRTLLGRLIDGGLLAMVKDGDRTGIDTLLKSVLGDDCDTERIINRQ